MGRSAREITAALAKADRERAAARRKLLRGVVRAAGDIAVVDEAGQVAVKAAERALAEAVRRVELGNAEAVARAGEQVAVALEVFGERELAEFSGVPVASLRQWVRSARAAQTSPAPDQAAIS